MPGFTQEYGKQAAPEPGDGRLDAPVYHRNHDVIRGAIAAALGDKSGDAVEIGSGTGQHAVGFARALPAVTWWPTDNNPKHLASIEAWRRFSGLANLMTPYNLDAGAGDWGFGGPGAPPAGGLLVMVSVNVFHITPWAVAEGIIRGAARYLGPDGCLMVYRPFRIDGRHSAASNAEFDASLRAENSDWGVRDTAELAATAARHGLNLAAIDPVPANNFILTFARDDTATTKERR